MRHFHIHCLIMIMIISIIKYIALFVYFVIRIHTALVCNKRVESI